MGELKRGCYNRCGEPNIASVESSVKLFKGDIFVLPNQLLGIEVAPMRSEAAEPSQESNYCVYRHNAVDEQQCRMYTHIDSLLKAQQE